MSFEKCNLVYQAPCVLRISNWRHMRSALKLSSLPMALEARPRRKKVLAGAFSYRTYRI